MSIMFVIDMVVRILGLGFEDFFEDKWNQLDFYLVIGMVALEIFPEIRSHITAMSSSRFSESSESQNLSTYSYNVKQITINIVIPSMKNSEDSWVKQS